VEVNHQKIIVIAQEMIAFGMKAIDVQTLVLIMKRVIAKKALTVPMKFIKGMKIGENTVILKHLKKEIK
jgi:hypothetical protein